MGTKKLTENLDELRARFAKVAQEQLRLAEKLYTGRLYIAGLKNDYEVLVGVLCTKHEFADCVVYVQDCGTMGFRAAKFYTDGLDYRIGSFQESAEWALKEAQELL